MAIYGTKYSRMDQVKLWKAAFKEFEMILICLSKIYVEIYETKFEVIKADNITSKFLKTAFHKFYLVHYGILCPILFGERVITKNSLRDTSMSFKLHTSNNNSLSLRGDG